jgi:hypothetical protein
MLPPNKFPEETWPKIYLGQEDSDVFKSWIRSKIIRIQYIASKKRKVSTKNMEYFYKMSWRQQYAHADKYVLHSLALHLKKHIHTLTIIFSPCLRPMLSHLKWISENPLFKFQFFHVLYSCTVCAPPNIELPP